MEYVLFALALFALAGHLVASASALRALRRRPARAAQGPLVSILKPVKGLDDQLEENLESFFRLDYPTFELLFCAPDHGEPALAIIERLRAKHRHVRSRVVVGESAAGLNPKVRVLANATRFARGELLLVSDSNVRVRPSYLGETLSELDDPSVAAASNLVAGVGERSLGASLENLQLNGFIVPAVSLSQALRDVPCVMGKSMLLRRSDFEAVGGWAALRDVLAEDYVLGQRLAARGLRAVISSHVVDTVNEHWSLGRFIERHDRWLKMRWRINPWAILLELVSNVTIWAVAAVAAAGFAYWSVAAAALIVAGRAALDAVVTARLRPSRPLRPWQLLLVPVRDLALAALWGHALFSRSVRWRGGQRLLVGHDSQLSLPAAHGRPTPAPVALPEPFEAAQPALTTDVRR
jgi:ceramide glucosyltransferase